MFRVWRLGSGFGGLAYGLGGSGTHLISYFRTCGRCKGSSSATSSSQPYLIPICPEKGRLLRAQAATENRDPKPWISDPEPETLDPKFETLNAVILLQP